MLLGGLCALFQEGKRLPQDQHALYTRLVGYVLHNRYPNDAALVAMAQSRLAVIAHGMHTGAGLEEKRSSPQFEVTHREIERMLEAYLQASAATEEDYRGTVEAREDLGLEGRLVQLRGEGLRKLHGIRLRLECPVLHGPVHRRLVGAVHDRHGLAGGDNDAAGRRDLLADVLEQHLEVYALFGD